MPRYTLIPDEHEFDQVEIVAADAGRLLAMIHRVGWNAARVLQDGRYIFTVALNPKGYWAVLPGLPESADGPCTDAS